MSDVSPEVEVAIRSVVMIGDGDRQLFDATIAPDAVNRESVTEPPACRVAGPAGFFATAMWLRSAFAGLDHQVHHAVGQGDLAVVDVTMSGRHEGAFVTYRPDGTIDRAWAPTGRSFAVRQCHWIRVEDGLVTEHWAARDDLGQAFQLGWLPPTPGYLMRCASAARRARKALATT